MNRRYLFVCLCREMRTVILFSKTNSCLLLLFHQALLASSAHAGDPVFIPLSLVLKRLRQGYFYRHWDEVEADLERVVLSYPIGGPKSKVSCFYASMRKGK